ncbi:AAA family ATPase [Endothiovibrio diazotrophicus]
MIDSIQLQDFKNHRDTRIKLGRLTLLVGPNGSGKTSVLQAIHFACQSVNQGQVSENTAPKKSARAGQSHSTVAIGGTYSGKPWIFEISTDPAHSGSIAFHWETKRYAERHPLASFLIEDGELPPWDECVEQTPSTIHYRADARRLAQPCYSDDEIPSVAVDGYGLASTLAYLMTYDPDRFRQLEEGVRSVIPSVKRLRVRPARIEMSEQRTVAIGNRKTTFDDERTVTGHELVVDMDSGDELPAHAVSEGTLMTIGLLTVISGPTNPEMVLLDDIDHALHPRAQRELVATLRRLLEQTPGLQIVATSHSPYLVDELAPEEVWVLAADSEGIAAARRLADHPEAERALQVLSTGEFLSAEGEEWVLDAGERHALAGNR